MATPTYRSVNQTATLLGIPLTEIVATVRLSGAAVTAVGADACVPPPADVVVGVPVVAPDEPAAGADVPHVGVAQAWTCCLNGSLLWKRSKVTSWPDDGGRGTLGSLTPSEDVAVEGPAGAPDEDPAVEPPSRVGGARAGEPVAVVLAGVDGVAVLGPFNIFIVRGTWKASRPSRRTPPAIAIFFCFAAFSLLCSCFVFLAMA